MSEYETNEDVFESDVDIVEYDFVPEFKITKHSNKEFSIEWEMDNDEDYDDAWAIITIDEKNNHFMCSFEYEDFDVYIDNYEESSFKEYIYNLDNHKDEFAFVLNKIKVFDPADSYEAWIEKLEDLIIEDVITEEKAEKISDFLFEVISTNNLETFVTFKLSSSPLLLSNFSDPLQNFEIIYNYPPCTKFFFTNILPIIKKIIKDELNK